MVRKKKSVYNLEEDKESQEEYEDCQHLAREQIVEDETRDEIRQDMDLGEVEESVYSEVGRDDLLEDDEISASEEAFMEGAEQKGELGTCAHCGKPIGEERDEVVERKLRGEILWFCSERCAKAGRRKVLSED